MNQPGLAPLVDDMCVFVGGGRSEASLILKQAAEAERLGFRRALVTERYNVKEGAVLAAAIAARTSRLEVGITAMPIAARLPILTAAVGATLHSAFGPRCVLGLGRGIVENNMPYGLGGVASYEALTDYARILKRLWLGDTVDYDGPAGSYHGLVFNDRYDGPPPQVWFSHFGGPRASKASADPAIDGVILTVPLTPDAVRRSVATMRTECERIGRDPGSLRVVALVGTAPDIDEVTVDDPELIANPAYGNGPITVDALRVMIALTLQQGTSGTPIARNNRWDEQTCQAIAHHTLYRGMDPAKGELGGEHRMRNRMDMMEAAELVPESWLRECYAIGPAKDCVAKLREFTDAGADEIGIYISTPTQNAAVISEWRRQRGIG